MFPFGGGWVRRKIPDFLFFGGGGGITILKKRFIKDICMNFYALQATRPFCTLHFKLARKPFEAWKFYSKNEPGIYPETRRNWRIQHVVHISIFNHMGLKFCQGRETDLFLNSFGSFLEFSHQLIYSLVITLAQARVLLSNEYINCYENSRNQRKEPKLVRNRSVSLP